MHSARASQERGEGRGAELAAQALGGALPLSRVGAARALPDRMEVKRSTRVRKASAYVRVFDEHTRNEIKRKRLDALEKDNWQEEKQAVGDEEDDDYNPMDDGDDSGEESVAVGSKRTTSKKKKKRRQSDVWNAAQKCKSLREIIDEAEYHKYPSWVPNYVSIAAAPSRYPPRRFCSVTGLAGKYKCPVTGDYLATIDAYTTHRETRLKGLI